MTTFYNVKVFNLFSAFHCVHRAILGMPDLRNRNEMNLKSKAAKSVCSSCSPKKRRHFSPKMWKINLATIFARPLVAAVIAPHGADFFVFFFC